MEVIVNNNSVKLQKRDRKVGSEAPAVKVKMLSQETKVIGMMAQKVQVMISLPYSHSLNDDINRIIHRYRDKATVYLISSDDFAYNVNPNFSSNDFENFALKFGVYINEHVCAKSIFIIDKEGEIVYKNVLSDLLHEFDAEKFDSELQKAVDFKKKGHTHENWMSA